MSKPYAIAAAWINGDKLKLELSFDNCASAQEALGRAAEQLRNVPHTSCDISIIAVEIVREGSPRRPETAHN